MKTCFKCGVDKSIEEFYRHPGVSDGHLGKCKECTKRDVRVDRLTSPNAREYDLNRSSLPHRKELRKRISSKWRIDHPVAARAQIAANNAVRDGRLKRETVYSKCGSSRSVQKHHHDYSKPLAVVWLCKPCHAIADSERRAQEATS